MVRKALFKIIAKSRQQTAIKQSQQRNQGFLPISRMRELVDRKLLMEDLKGRSVPAKLT